MRRKRTDKPEPTIALINVVFLMLVFFLVAGTIARPPDTTVQLVRTADLDPAQPPDALVIHPDGTLYYRGAMLSDVTDYLTPRRPLARRTCAPRSRSRPLRRTADRHRRPLATGRGRTGRHRHTKADP